MLEIDWTNRQLAIAFIILSVLLWLTWHFMGYFELDKPQEYKHTRSLTNAQYGAYVWLSGKRYN
jgi:hypothetical protein